MKNSIIKNYIYNSGLLIFNLVFPFITMIYVNEIFSVSIIGEISLALSLGNIFISLSSLGISNYAMREIAQNRRDKIKLKEIFSKYLFINIIGVILFSIVYFFIIFIFLKNKLYIYSILYLNIFMSPFILEWFYIGLEEYEYITKRSIFIKIVSFLFMIFFVKKETDMILYLIFLVLGNSLNGIFNLYRARKYIKKIKINFKEEIVRLKYFYLQGVIGIFYNGCEQIVLGLNSSNEQVAYYSRSKQLLSLPRAIIVSLTRTLSPSINNKINEKDEYIKLVCLSFNYLSLLMFPSIIGICILSKNILYLIGDFKFLPAKNILSLLSLQVLVTSLAIFFDTNISTPNRKEKNTLYGNICVMIVTTLLSLLLSKKYGGLGVAFSVIIGESLGVIIQIFFIKRQKIFVKIITKNFYKYIIASILMGIILLIIKLFKFNYVFEFLISIFIGGIFYFFFLFLLREELITNIIKKVIKRKGISL